MDPSPKPRVLFVNCPRAHCSIFESGQMFLTALRESDAFELDSVEVHRFEEVPTHGYDVYAFNWHLMTMPRFDTKRVASLPGVKLAFVLEVLPNDPFPLTPDHFDGYCAIDPTMNHPDPRVFAFPRPLATVDGLPPYRDRGVPVIGSFGFATPGKNFDRIVRAAGEEFDRAIVRLHLPPASHADPDGSRARAAVEACQAEVRPGIDLEISHHYLSDRELIDWCAQNTLNCFFYERKIPGLAATTDQAVIAGRPLLVSDSATFRHVHEYVRPWPEQSLREAIETAGEGVRAMRRAWSYETFRRRFEQVLAHFGCLPGAGERTKTIPARPRAMPADERNVLFVNHRTERCGIHEYGRTTFDALATSKRYRFHYLEAEDASTFLREAGRVRPGAVIYNYHHATMPWVCSAVIHGVPAQHVGIVHEFQPRELEHEWGELFDRLVVGDPTIRTANPRVHAIGRVVPPYAGSVEPPGDMLTIGSFGMGLPGKGFDQLVALVCREFDEARVRLHIPISGFGDPDGCVAAEIAKECRALVSKPGVSLEIDHDFLSADALLDFLAGNHLNALLYDDQADLGISSCVDWTLAVRRPLALSASPMFRHVHDAATASICIGERSLREILAAGAEPLRGLRERWTREQLCRDYERVLGSGSARTPGGRIERIGGVV